MSTRKEQHVYATVPRATDSHKLSCWLSIIKNTWSCRSPLSSCRFVPRTHHRVLANSHELDLRILSLILIALESHDLTRRPPTDRQMVSSIYALVYMYYVYLYRYNKITYSNIFTFAAFQLVSVGLNRITGTQWCRSNTIAKSLKDNR